MEFEDVSEKIEWEARRVAAAFGVKEWEILENSYYILYGETKSRFDVSVNWRIRGDEGVLSQIEVLSKTQPLVSLGLRFTGRWILSVFQERHAANGYKGHELMTCGLYRLGFEDESIFSRLPPLTAHELLELRLSLPREFWPQKWLDEEGE